MIAVRATGERSQAPLVEVAAQKAIPVIQDHRLIDHVQKEQAAFLDLFGGLENRR